MLSLARSITHLMAEVTTLKANVLLKRRDVALTLLPTQVAEGIKKKLRQFKGSFQI